MIELRWDCRTEPEYHEMLQYRVIQEIVTAHGKAGISRRDAWSEWIDVPFHTDTTAAGGEEK